MTMSRIPAWLAFVALLQLGAVASAQDMSFDLDEAESEDTGGEEEAAAEAEGDFEMGGEAGGDSDMDLITDLAEDEDSDVGAEEQGPRPTEVVEEIYAVQQIYALRKNRLELAVAFGTTLNDPFVSHPSPRVGVNYWVTNVLGIGVDFSWFQGLENESDLNFHVRRSTRLAIRPTEFQFGLSVPHFVYVPLYGKFAMFNEFIFQWDAYVLGGFSLMRTRPVSVVDPEFRTFDFDWRFGFNVALGLRIFLSKWLTVFGELRANPYLEKLENLNVALGGDRECTGSFNTPECRDGWLDNESTVVTNFMLHAGVTLYFPFTFDYKLPK